MLPTKFQVNWPFGSGEKAKNRFSAILEFRSEQFLAIFDLQATPMFPTKFRVNWIGLLVQEKRKIDFQ